MSQAKRSAAPNSSLGVFHVRTPPSLHLTGPDSPERAAGSTTSSSASSTSTSGSSTRTSRAGSSSRTPTVSSNPGGDGTLPPSSTGFSTAGMVSRTEWVTLDTSVRISDAVESSFSDILEATPDPQGKFWVSSEQAATLMERVTQGSKTPDPALLQCLSEAISSGSGAKGSGRRSPSGSTTTPPARRPRPTASTRNTDAAGATTRRTARRG